MIHVTAFRHVRRPIVGMVNVVSHGMMPTPGVVIDGLVVHAGGVPSRQKAEGWFQGGAV